MERLCRRLAVAVARDGLSHGPGRRCGNRPAWSLTPSLTIYEQTTCFGLAPLPAGLLVYLVLVRRQVAGLTVRFFRLQPVPAHMMQQFSLTSRGRGGA